MTDELVGSMVEQYCPPQKHFEDWDWQGLGAAFEEQFVVSAPELRDKFNSAQEIAEKLYEDADNVLKKKMEEIGSENFLRLFRNSYLQEIDRRWIEHLQDMEKLRDGIGLRGYGQRDPKKEYQREGFAMFMDMVRGIKASVTRSLFAVRRVREEDLQALEAQRRQAVERRQQQMRTQHPEGAGGQAQAPQPGQQQPLRVQVAPAGTIRAQGRPVPQQRPMMTPPAAQGGAPPEAQQGQPMAPQPQPREPMNRHERRALEKKQKKAKGTSATK
jgi:preprotein translocase subunit SecA